MTDFASYQDTEVAKEDGRIIDAMSERAQRLKWTREKLYEVLKVCGMTNDAAKLAAEEARPASMCPTGPWAS